jgi:putative transcriptional regulator
MKEFITTKDIDKNDLKRLRETLDVTQAELADLINVSKKTVERWEASEKKITGPITALFQLFINNPNLAENMEIDSKKFALRMLYYYKNHLCTIIDVDEKNRRVKIRNYQTELIYRAFGKNENPTYEEFEEFLESRSFPRERDKMKISLEELDIPFYEPMLIVEKTNGRMAEDDFWIKIERDR